MSWQFKRLKTQRCGVEDSFKGLRVFAGVELVRCGTEFKMKVSEFASTTISHKPDECTTNDLLTHSSRNAIRIEVRVSGID